MTHLISEYYAIEMPDYECEIILDLQPKEDWYKIDFIRKPGYDGKESIGYTLPPGNYKLIGTSDGLTEERCYEIIEFVLFGVNKTYKDYTGNRIGISAKMSFQSLLKSKGLTKRYAILQQVK